MIRQLFSSSSKLLYTVVGINGAVASSSTSVQVEAVSRRIIKAPAVPSTSKYLNDSLRDWRQNCCVSRNKMKSASEEAPSNSLLISLETLICSMKDNLCREWWMSLDGVARRRLGIITRACRSSVYDWDNERRNGWRQAMKWTVSGSEGVR